jgi:xylulokinase
LGIDAGTSRVRALVFEPDGTVISSGDQAAVTVRPKPRWAEQDAEDLWQAFVNAVKQALATVDEPARIRGLGIGSVGEAFVPLDDRLSPTYPVIAWYDQRPADELDRLFQHIDRDRLFAITGLGADPTFSLMKLLWLKRHAPEALARTRHILNVTHYFAWRLTGVMAADLTQASRSLALDLHHLSWADDLIREVGLDPSIFPPLRPLGDRLGTILPDIAKDLGLSSDCAVGIGGHDHILGALAADALAPGTMLNSMGTAEAVTFAQHASSHDPDVGRRGFNQGAARVDDRTIPYVFGGFQTSGGAIEWFRALFGAERGHDALISEAEAVVPGAQGLLFVPDLRGRLISTPDPKSRGAWIGLTMDHSHAALYRAVLEGLAFEARLSVDELEDIDGMPSMQSIRAIGGNTQNALLMRIKASVFQQPITATVMPEATALGAAILGGVAAGLWLTTDEAVQGLSVSYEKADPVEEWVGFYDQAYQDVYKHAFDALRPFNHALHAQTST